MAIPSAMIVILSGGSGPGTPHTDGWLTMTTMGNAGMPLLDSIEVDEIHHPMVIHQRRLIADGEGAGQFRGAPGMRVEFGPMGCDMELGYVSDGSINPAKGARGGMSAAPASHYKRAPDGSLTEVPDVSAQFGLAAGESIVSNTAGGGGYGSPLARDPEAGELKDVQEGWITAERAHDVYGVVLGNDGAVDPGATEEKRHSIRTIRTAGRA